jgi:hypothetical protein
MKIKRRTFMQSLGVMLGIPLLGGASSATAAAVPEGLTYSDSDGRTNAQLAAMGDAITLTGGISYNP